MVRPGDRLDPAELVERARRRRLPPRVPGRAPRRGRRPRLDRRRRSRRPPTRPSASTCGATRSTASPSSPSPTSARPPTSTEVEIFPCRELLPTDEVRARAAELVAPRAVGPRAVGAAGRGPDVRRHGVVAAVAGRRRAPPRRPARRRRPGGAGRAPAHARPGRRHPRRGGRPGRDAGQDVGRAEREPAGSRRLHLPFDRLLAHTDAPVWTIDQRARGARHAGGRGRARWDPVVGRRHRARRPSSPSCQAQGYRRGRRRRRRRARPADGIRRLARAERRGHAARCIVVAPLERGFILPVGPAGRARRDRRHRPAPRPPAAAGPAHATPSGFFDDLKPGDYVVHHHHGVARYGGMVTRGDRRRRARLPAARVPGRRQALRPLRPDRRRPPLHRRRDAGAQPARRQRVAQDQGPGAVGGPGDRPGAGRALPEAGQQPGPRVPRGHPVAARARGGRSRTRRRPTSSRPSTTSRPTWRSRSRWTAWSCGDVGFGKTEVAIRAAFKAVQDGKQVAVLVPTTLLAQQHFQTFCERFAGYPVRVEVLTRFLTAGPGQEGGRAGWRRATVDVVIGTHRLLSDDIAFKDLGLLVVDEEQRFGVHPQGADQAATHQRRRADAHRHADPAHARDEPHRHPRPHAAQHAAGRAPADPHLRRRVRRAGRRPRRSGASCCARARCSSCTTGCTTSSTWPPTCASSCPRPASPWPTARWTRAASSRWCSTSGRAQYDVLVCTTIIESGIDMPTVNTLVVDRADLLGLGQLHQLRGRVGRAGQRAYAYLFYPPERRLTEEAYERLKTIGEATELGSRLQDRHARPRDPRRRQPARRGPVRPHRRRRLRPLLPDGHRGGGRAEGRGGPGAGRDQARPARRRQPPARLRRARGAPARGLPPAGRRDQRRRGRRHPPRVGGPLRPGARPRPRRCSTSPGCGPRPSASGSRRSTSPADPASAARTTSPGCRRSGSRPANRSGSSGW